MTIGLGLIGVCHLPIAMKARIAILCVVGAALGVLRYGIGDVPWSSAIWPVLGSMFALRMIVYLYDRSHETAPPRLSQTLGYFFLLPNVCFPLFPVVDFKKFCRHYYDQERHTIYQVGVEWIWRGLLQLLVYRVVYYHLTFDPVAVSNLGQLLVYMLSTYLMYVRVSGHFHLIIGILHLFGFNLPEAHHRYLLASSFTDFWRRINIYWKDFMMKVFYYPAFFRFRTLGDTKAMVLAVVYTFFATWLLHIVQWYWIRRSFLLQWNDVIFWAIFCALVIANSLHEARPGRTRMLSRGRTLRESAGLVFRTIGTFGVVCMLWSFWTAESITDWRLMMRAATVVPEWWRPLDVALVSAGIVAATLLAIYVTWKGWGAVDQRPVGTGGAGHDCDHGCRALSRYVAPGRPARRLAWRHRFATIGVAEPPRRAGLPARLLREPARGRQVQSAAAAGLREDTAGVRALAARASDCRGARTTSRTSSSSRYVKGGSSARWCAPIAGACATATTS